MSDEEKVRNFGDMVDAVEKLTKPIQEENIRLHEQIEKIQKDRKEERKAFSLVFAFVVFVFGVVFFAFILLAYLTPVSMEQGQELPEGTQSQSYSEGATYGG